MRDDMMPTERSFRFPRPLPPRDQMRGYLQSLLAQIDQVDRDTPWSARETQWWLDMMEIRRLAAKFCAAH